MPISETHFSLPGQTGFYKGKVRDVYYVDDLMVAIATDRISAFDYILPRPIPYKGQVLNQLAAYFLDATKDIVPNWKQAMPHPNVTIGVLCEPIRIEMVIRGYLAGHALRQYHSGRRNLCGEEMPEGMKDNAAFPQPIITPATKAESGHDVDISGHDIIAQGILSRNVYNEMVKITKALFKRGTEMAAKQGLILVDTKYEFGWYRDQLYIIDEVHTPDSSRYWYADKYEFNQEKGLPQEQLSKEFVREWLMSKGFQGLEGQTMPVMDDEFVETVSNRYIHLYELMTGSTFVRGDEDPVIIQKAIEGSLSVH
ncbi:MAG: phosphoribosylaminoimidazolesuccinocarboxamide synthase [Saprospiraceae bacterium]|uniref:Phosphoribosylaminoimidazole-succinocarboxamide synthase n=1 Tax=Candidatus Opimibacter skivensis TaxID=2982028 RepID=A0A9D7SZK4_9BACT|nr:phosphoribosylaminoimidazolesuccinocarboxamide synthase [Candidatus Opimibacter skivensis]